MKKEIPPSVRETACANRKESTTPIKEHDIVSVTGTVVHVYKDAYEVELPCGETVTVKPEHVKRLRSGGWRNRGIHRDVATDVLLDGSYSQKWRLYDQLCRLAKICEENGCVEQVIIHGNPDKRSQVGCSDPIVTIEEMLRKPSVKDITKG